MKVSRSIVLGAIAAGGMVLAVGNPASASCAYDDDWDDDVDYSAYEDNSLEAEVDHEDYNETWTVAHVGKFHREQNYNVDVDIEDNDTAISHSIINSFD